MTPVEDNANRQIARSAGKVMVALLLSNLTNLVSLILNATTFGTQADMDAFLAANRVSETLFVLMAGGALGSAFIPTFTGLLTKGERNPAWKLASAIANLVLIIMIIAAVLAAIFAQPLVHYILAPGFASQPGQEALTVNLLRIMLPSAVIFGLSGLVMGILNSHQVFFIPALTPAMYRLGMIFGVLFLTPTMGIYGLAWGVVIGACFHLLLQLPSLARLKGSYTPTLGLKIANVRQVGMLMLPRVFGVAVVQLNFWVNTYLASQMSEGSVTGISWGLTMMLMPQAIIAQSVAMAALPTLSAQYTLDKLDDLRRSLAASLRGILLLSIPASLGLILLRQPVTALMLQYGRFTEESTQLISWALLWYSAGLVGHCVVEILARAFYAMHDTKTPVLVGAVAMGLNVVFSLLFISLFKRLGWMPHGGLALANSLATALEAATLWIFMRRRLGGLEGRKVLMGTSQAALAAVAMVLVLWGWLGLTQARQAWLVGGGGVLVGGIVYALVVFVLKVPEVHSLLDLLKHRLQPASK
ncbi:MAG TPA: murein biosynthesis integral membrane protein MurJ [Anaerolineales bacterium]|nr:murein biosynthesis integral membrane protein MurJ [Anaerolineales bacterium]